MPARRKNPTRREMIQQLAGTYIDDLEHSNQETKLATQLFDELTSLHGLSNIERDWLEQAALLHDIGWVEGWKGHHKTSLRIILESQKLPFDQKERLIIGSIARYHRKSLPTLEHDHYAALQKSERVCVSKLAALLRIADGLDRTHRNTVQILRCVIGGDEVLIHCQVNIPAGEEEKEGTKKADLFEKVFKKKIIIQMGI
jgi:exopolyphosphatase/guanosine-5'-triphosphate,3'-diphosphate pyrophosphatase